MYCSNCGKEVPDQSTFCDGCGFRFQQGTPVQVPPVAQDGPIGGLGCLCMAIPVVGLILYLVWKDTTPMKAKGAGKMALWGVGISVGLYILYFVVILIVAGAGGFD